MTSEGSMGIYLTDISVFCLCLLCARYQCHPPPPHKLTFPIWYTMLGKGHHYFGFSPLVLLNYMKSPQSLPYINIFMLLSKACKGEGHFQWLIFLFRFRIVPGWLAYMWACTAIMLVIMSFSLINFLHSYSAMISFVVLETWSLRHAKLEISVRPYVSCVTNWKIKCYQGITSPVQSTKLSRYKYIFSLSTTDLISLACFFFPLRLHFQWKGNGFSYIRFPNHIKCLLPASVTGAET